VSRARLALLLTSPRVAPGLLSHEAWRAVADADRVLVRADDEPVAEALREAGVALEPRDEAPAVLARALVDLAADTDVVWCGSADGDPGLADAIASEVSRLEVPPEVEVVVGSWDVQGSRLLDVVAAMDRLRSPGGCPWDAEQTHESLAPYLVEEAHEVLHAIESGDREHLAEELGDVLLQVVFHARVAEEAGEDGFDVDTVAGLLVEKLVRRHPHVFADGSASTPAEVEEEWERIKATEKAAGAGEAAGAVEGGEAAGGYAADLLHGIPPSLPGDLASAKVLARMRRRGLTPAQDAVAQLERARAALAAAEADVREALTALAASADPAEA
jgi:XTP/dITP diphosphohydrolase